MTTQQQINHQAFRAPRKRHRFGTRAARVIAAILVATTMMASATAGRPPSWVKPVAAAPHGWAYLMAFYWEPTGTIEIESNYNSTGAVNTVKREATGSYFVWIPALSSGGSFQVTAVSAILIRCALRIGGDQESGQTASVNCHDVTGAPADSAFTLSYFVV